MESAVLATGRVVVKYHSKITQKSSWYSGSGIIVSPNYVLTAGHVVKECHEVYTLGQVSDRMIRQKIYFDNTPRVMIDDYNWEEWPHELIYQDNVVDELPEFKKSSDNIYSNQWKNKNDFKFLKLTTPFTVYRCAIPIPISPSPDPLSCFVVGYPSKITFHISYEKDTDEEKRRYFEEIKQLMDSFEKKIISVGSGKILEYDQVVNHFCPTIRGTSGGLFRIIDGSISSTDSITFFHGLHLGGNMRMKHNLSLLVTDKTFAWEYITKVLLNEPDFFNQIKCFVQNFLRGAIKENPAIEKLSENFFQ